ncbi:MAG: glucuronate isomerase, partial [Rhizobiaceae bacterium]|nr:glucuronate isomerase [Rhizobiaceae bacterium]
FSRNEQFPDPAQLLIVPDHYILRMLVSQGVSLSDLGVASNDGVAHETDGRKIWRLFAENYHLFRSTPVRVWMDHTLSTLFGIDERPSSNNADAHYDLMSEAIASNAFRPRALFERFNIEVLATTDACNDELTEHALVAGSDWEGTVIPTYRPDSVVDPDFEGFHGNIETLGSLTGEDVSQWQGYLNAHRARRTFFKSMGATATDHGHPTSRTADLSSAECETLYEKVLGGQSSPEERELFRAQMLTEMAGMSIEDGLVMQLHPGSLRNHHQGVFASYGRDKGFDIPQPANYTQNLKPLLNRYGMDPKLSLILFTLDETTYSRELAPLASVYPSLKLGPAWWFHDSPAGMMRYREQTTETAGYYNTAGFNDDTRAFPSIPARHDLARRIDCAFLARQVAEHFLDEDEAAEIAIDLAYRLAKRAYNL